MLFPLCGICGARAVSDVACPKKGRAALLVHALAGSVAALPKALPDKTASQPKLLQDTQKESEYERQQCRSTRPEDYTVSRESRTIGDNRQTAHEAERGSGAHWSSEYRSASAEGMSRRPTPQLTAQQILASRVVPAPHSCVSKVLDHSSHTADYGRHGSNPREKISPWEDKMP
eukprot:s8912_g1.t1